MSEQHATTVAFFKQLKNSQEAVLMLDYDGTLAPFQIDRLHAYPYPGVIPLLTGIQQTGKTRLIIITGRPIEEVQNLLQPLSGIEIWGAHGLEHMNADGIRREVSIAPEAASILQQAAEWVKLKERSSLIEVKPGGVAVHWRGLPAEEIREVQSNVLEGWTPLAKYQDIKLLHFEGGLELRITRPDKGDAVAAILNSLPLDTPVAFLGDDLTDEDGFRKLARRGLSILVRNDYRETAAKAWLRPPQELLEFLEQWLSQTGAGDPA